MAMIDKARIQSNVKSKSFLQGSLSNSEFTSGHASFASQVNKENRFIAGTNNQSAAF